MQELPIVIISGSNRPNNMTRKIVELIRPMYEAQNVPVEILDLCELPASMYNPESYGDKPEELKPFTDKILGAKGIVVVTPEYNGSMPGSLKYFIDMLPFPESFEHRCVAFIGIAAGIWGGLRPVEHLQHVFGYRNAFIYPNRVFLPKIYDIFKDPEAFKSDLAWQLLGEQAEGFVRFARAIADMKNKA